MILFSRRAVVRLVLPVLVLGLAGGVAPAALADWQEPVPGASPINQSSARNATSSDMVTIDGVPYVVWNEDTTEGTAGRSSTIRVARLADDGVTWEKVGNAGTHPISRLSSTSSENPSIADVGGVPWVAWEEGLTASNQEIRVARLNAAGTGWERIPDTLRPVNHLRDNPGGMGMSPTIVSDGGARPYVSFFEVDPGEGSLFFEGGAPAKVWVMRLSADGTTWEEVGGGHVNPLAEFDAAFPAMTLVDGVPWVTYFQVEVVNGAPSIGVRVSRLGEDGAWEQVADPVLSGGPGAIEAPDIAEVDGVPYVAMPATMGGPQTRVRVFSLDEATEEWSSVGTASPEGPQARDVSVEDVGGLPWVAWAQRSGESTVGAAVLREGGWEQVGSIYPTAGGDVRYGPSLADVNGFPWFSFSENDGQSPGGEGVESCCGQVRVARLEPEFGDSSSQPTDDSATLLTSVEDFGLPFPVGFEYGEEGSLDQTSPLAPAGQSSLLFRVVTGLWPSTLYEFRPVASAGTPQPLVRGGSSYFVTDPDRGDDDTPVLAITRIRDRVPQGELQRVKFFSTDAGTVRMRIVDQDGDLVAERQRPVEPAVDVMRWRARTDGGPAALGRYVVKLRLLTDDGARTGDRDRFRVVPR